jgi:glycosyltransferase involved in cell wall biosynthesis
MKTPNTDELTVPRKVLYISLDGMTDPLGQSQVLPYLSLLSQQDFRFTLISLEKRERFTQNKALIESICREAGIDWRPILYSQAVPIVSSVYNVFKLCQKAIALQKGIGFSTVHCRNYVCSIVGLRLKQRFGVKFICDTRGFWHEERLSDFKDKFLRGVIYRYFVQKEKAYFREADAIITLNETAKEEIKQRPEYDKTRTLLEVIPCCVDYELFTPLSIDAKKSIRAGLKIAVDEVVLGYVGSLGTIYMLDEMLDFLKIMLHKEPKSRFLILTLEPEATIFQRAKGKNIPLQNLIIKSATRKEVAFFLNAVDFTISFIKPLHEKRGCSPTKMGEYWAMNLPVIANDGVGDVGKIMADTEGGVLITEFSDNAYLQALETVFSFKNKDYSVREKSKKYYDLTEGVAKYYKIYTRLA